MQYWLFIIATPTSPIPSPTEKAILANQPSPIKTTSSSPTQNLTVEPSTKDYVPVPIVSVVIAGLIGIIATLVWKWHEAEIKRIEIQKGAEVKEKEAEVERVKIEKSAEIKLLDEQKKRELSEKDNEIKNLGLKIESLERTQEEFRQLTSIVPQEYIKETKPLLEQTIRELKERINLIEKEKNDISEEKEKIRLELESKLSAFESSLQKLSTLEKHLSDRAANIHIANLWLKKNQSRLGREACEIALQRVSQNLNYQNNDLEQKALQFVSDIKDYLIMISECLNLGRTNLLDKARAEIPPVIHPEFYAEAFKIIRDEKAPAELSNDNSVREVQLYLNYLVKLFQNESN